MNYTNTIFNQLLELLPRNRFEQFVGQHKADKYVKKMSCWNQLSIMLYAQAKGKESLRDIETGLLSQENKIYHLGLQSVAKSTIAEANRDRPYQIYESLFYELFKVCKELSPNAKFEFDNPLKAIDSTTIILCLKLFPWAKFSKAKGAIKLHCLFDIRSQIPEFVVESGGHENDLAVAKNRDFVFSPDSITVMDRAYIDFKWFYEKIHKQKAYFVVRLKKNIKYFVIENSPVFEEGIISDQKIVLSGGETLENYPEDVRLVSYYDKETEKTYQFLTNNFVLSAKTIADIYKARWQIELFFKWIKQHLKIKTFFGTSKNAVLVQIWIAMIYYLLVSYIKGKTKFSASILKLTRILSEVLMDRVSIIDILGLKPHQLYKIRIRDDTQLVLC
ncbi:IS4 family transposase [Candidatus Peregrinibacteria bacterium CG_4_9_14_0_2_um_filter_38_9]|nr:MAG: IS4 family transposase [Candidatus Peregrinibacteria bacterium CG_4_9_14_0_2_um_filter_38_9]